MCCNRRLFNENNKKVINIFFWIWSHCPVICLSDDDYFATLKFDNIRNAHLRFSLLNIMLGDSVIYVFHTI